MDRAEVLASIDKELAITAEQMDNLSPGPRPGKAGTVTIAALIVLNALLFVLSPAYGPLWITSTLFVTLVLSVVAFLPTTRSTAGIGGLLIPVRKLRNAAAANKRVLAALLISSFLVGGVPLVPGMFVLLSASIMFTIMLLLLHPDLLLPGLLVMGQCLLIITFYLWLMKLRPYSDEFLEKMSGIVSSIRKGAGMDRGRPLLQLGLVIVISSTVLIGVFLLPGFTLRIMAATADATLAHYVLPILLIMVTQIFIVRGWQARESRRWAVGFLKNKQKMLLIARKELENGSEPDICFERLLMERLMRLQSHDLFGRLPVYSLFPDLDLLLTKDLQEELALITPSEALRNTGY